MSAVATLPAFAQEAAELGAATWPRGSRGDVGYGTAGFRTTAEALDHVFYRMGVLAALRSKALGGKAVGVMVTASHNPERDNGVKIVDPMGEMLAIEWEAHAMSLANASDDDFAKAIADLAAAVGTDINTKAHVIVGRDTRASSVRLSLGVFDGAGVMQPSMVRSLGQVTTPQLHYIVRCENTAGQYGVPSLFGYASKLTLACKSLVQMAGGSRGRYKPQLTIDCANGVGAVSLKRLLPQLADAGLEVTLRNMGEGPLNEGCGADFVKIKQAAPSGVELAAGQRFVSFDGDADRIVYFFSGGDGAFRLLDGDRLALILAQFLATRLGEAGIEGLRLGLVQTAYANGASTARAVESVGEANVLCAKTGVKHCHHAATVLDIGIYFEANGHGTVIFSDKFVELATAASKGEDAKAVAAKQLLLLRDVMNETCGDAISNVLAVEAVLCHLDWSCEEWFAMYSDLPNRQIKVVVSDRSAFETTNAERTCVKPEGLQEAVDKLVASYPKGRCFVRPSGTEDVVRVYAEAETLEATLALAKAVVDVVYDTAGGVGERPVIA